MEPHIHTDSGESGSSRRRSIIGPLLLIGIGLAFLAQNFGLLSSNIWVVLWHLWPAWLILAGLDLLIGRRTPWGSWALGGIAVVVLGGALLLGDALPGLGNRTPGELVQVSQPIEGASRADVRIGSGVGRLLLSPASSDLLIEGQITPLANERINQSGRTVGDRLTYTLESRGMGWGFPGTVNTNASWDLRLSDRIPLSLDIDGGVGDTRIDLTGIQLTNLTLDTGVGDTDVTLPAQGIFRVKVDAGVGDLTLRLPKELAARIRIDKGVGSVSVNGGFNSADGYYVSPNFEGAEHRVEIELDAGVGSIRVIQF